MSRHPKTEQPTPYTLYLTPDGQVRRCPADDDRPCRRKLPGRATIRRAAILEQYRTLSDD